MFKTLVVAAALWATASAASAATYRYVGASGSGALFIDADTLKADGDHRVFWSSFFLFANGAETPRTAYVLTHDEVDCAGNQSRHLEGQTYDEAGKAVTALPAAIWLPTVPGSTGALTQEIACGAAPGGENKFPSEPVPMLRLVRLLKDQFR
jgi:hypothetical protein